MQKYEYLISACLVGENCRWDGGNCLNEQLKKLFDEGKVYPVCPEQLGGLPTPRPPSEIIGGEGIDVVEKRTCVRNKQGIDVTDFFIRGAYKTLEIVCKYRIDKVIFKDKSSSCGYGKIFDGTFTNTLRKGNGVTCALLLKNKIEVITEKQFLSIL